MTVVPLTALMVVFFTVVGTGLFFLWVIRSVLRGIAGMFRPSQKKLVASTSNIQMCCNESCRTENPTHARFCRRCGYSLPNLMRLRNDSAAA